MLLRVFRNPWLLASVVVLLINDHLLKATIPSWLTGKLSDFAGLFFFPFVLGVGIESILLLRRRRAALPHPTAALLAAFAVTGACFAALKTIPQAGALAAAWLTQITGLPGQIVRDPGDLAALVMFWPAWRLWQRHWRQWRRVAQTPPASAGSSNRWACTALAVAALAALASDCPPPSGITRIVAQDGVVYAGRPYESGYGITYSYFTSQDGGRTWGGRLETVPESIRVRLDGKTVLPYEVCTDLGRRCYRTGAGASEEPLIEVNADGGKTWQTAWQIPAGRYEYMQRARVNTCDTVPDHQMFDLLLLDGAGYRTDKPVLLAAMGNEGILRHEEDGAWERIGVGEALPSPYAAANLKDGISFTNEFFLGLGAAVLAFILLSGLAWQQLMRLPRKDALPAGRGLSWALQPLWYLAGWFGLIILFAILITFASEGIMFFAPFIIPLTPVFLLIALVQVWMRVGELTAFRKLPERMAGAAVLSAVGVFLAGWIPPLLWVMWVIQRYPVAMTISVIGMLVAFIAGGWAIVRAARSIDLKGGMDEQTEPEEGTSPARRANE